MNTFSKQQEQYIEDYLDKHVLTECDDSYNINHSALWDLFNEIHCMDKVSDKQIRYIDSAISQIQDINQAINRLDLERLDTTLLNIKRQLNKE